MQQCPLEKGGTVEQTIKKDLLKMFVLQLNSEQSGVWIETDGDGGVVSQRAITELSDCPKIEPHAKLAVLLPGETVSMRAVKLPKMRQSERMQAIPFALEEQLATEPDRIGIAIGRDLPDGALRVAVFDRAAFEKLMAALREQDLNPTDMLPDYLALPWEAGVWSVAVRDDIALVRTSEQNGFAVDVANLFILLELALGKADITIPDRIICWQHNNVIDTTKLQTLGLEVMVRSVETDTIFDMKSLLTSPAVNLLQGKYRPRVKTSRLRKNWMLCGITAAVYFGLLFGGHLVQLIYFNHESNVYAKQIKKMYQSIFPGSTSVLEPHFRITKLLQQMKTDAHGSEFLRLLADAGKVTVKFPKITIANIGFEKVELVLTVQAPSINALSQLTRALSEAGLQVNQNILKTGKTAVHADLKVKEMT